MGDCSRLWGQWRRRTFLRKSFRLLLAHKAWSCQKMSEAGKRVCIYAVILTDTWDHLQKGSNDTEMRLSCTESYMILEASEGNREQGWCDGAYDIEQQAWRQHSAPSEVYQWDSWVLLQTRSHNSPVLRKQKQKSAFWSRHRKGTDEWRQRDAVLRGADAATQRRHWWHAGAKWDNSQW